MDFPSSSTLHVFFLPHINPDHVLPMVGMAKLFAERGVNATVVTTPCNDARIRDCFVRPPNGAAEGGRDAVQLLLVDFPSSVKARPLDGCDSLVSLPTPEIPDDFIRVLATLREPLELLIEEHNPDAIISDSSYPWTADVAVEFGIPRLVFHGCSGFALAVLERLVRARPHQGVSDDAVPFVVPDLPDRIELTRSRIPKYILSPAPDCLERIKLSYLKSYGMVINSFRELEPGYNTETAVGQRAWYVGPLSLCNKLDADMALKGDKVSGANIESSLTWLEKQAPGSVLYVCFGSHGRSTASQLREIALALETGGHPFLWMFRDANGRNGAKELPEGFEERVADRGRVSWGWAPQDLILGHRAIGGFVTHCGCNSTLEAIAAGIPMVTWPLFAEHFVNEKFVVQVLRVGVAVGATVCSTKEEERVLVEKERVAAAVARVMGGGEEAEALRRRARELEAMARKAVQAGGSSHTGMDNLIKELVGVKKWR